VSDAVVGSVQDSAVLADPGRSGRRQIIELVRADGATELLTSYVPGKGDPGAFYEGFGFEPTGEIDDGEIVLRLPLTDR
jgi:diamine N-acetyltransferase